MTAKHGAMSWSSPSKRETTKLKSRVERISVEREKPWANNDTIFAWVRWSVTGRGFFGVDGISL